MIAKLKELYKQKHPGVIAAAVAGIVITFGSTLSLVNASAPIVTSLEPGTITTTTAEMKCAVNPGNETTNVWAAYGENGQYGSTTPKVQATGSSLQTIIQSVSGLKPGTQYNYKCKATNKSARTAIVGSVINFTTPLTDTPPPPPGPITPSVTTLQPTNITETSAKLNCKVSPGGIAAEVWLEYKPSTDPWGGTVPTDPPADSGTQPAGNTTVTSTKQVAEANSTQTIFVDVAELIAQQSYDVRCTADNAETEPVVGETVTFIAETPTAVTIMTAGDICDPLPATCQGVADLLGFHLPNKWVPLGDNQYDSGTLSQYNASYNVAFGPYMDITEPVIGNHEIKSGDSGYCSYFGPKANCPTHSYRTDLGDWSLIVLDTNGSTTTAKKDYFTALLNEAGSDNVVLAFHHPRFSSPCGGCHSEATKIESILQIALDRGVDVVLTGHDHKYERFDRMGTNGPLATGIPHFLSGAGGAHPDEGCTSRRAGSVFCAGGTNAGAQAAMNNFSATGFEGALKLSLRATDFGFEFIHANGTPGGAVIDSGTHAVR